MTTEIAILNKSAIALAADSAVTHASGTQEDRKMKVRNTANKLFTLSKYAPVGFMIYGSASVNGIPWETIVKMYREGLENQKYSTLKEYCDDFFSFLDSFDMPESCQIAYITDETRELFRGLKGEATRLPEEKQEAFEIRFTEHISSQYNEFQDIGNNSSFSKDERTELELKYGNEIKAVAESVFKEMTLSKQLLSQLTSIAVNAASTGRKNQSGIVIAGFGEKDIFPECCVFDVAAIFEGKTVMREDEGKSAVITCNNAAAIVPLAQSKKIFTFIRGIEPGLQELLNKDFLENIPKKLTSRSMDDVSKKLKLSKQQLDVLSDIITTISTETYKEIIRTFDTVQYYDYIKPMIDATKNLGKSDLATMAETLVNLVSFSKVVSMEAETVGGPIDVAVITKGDGFVWIKRKHYFSPELNHHFFSNYHRSTSTGEQKD